MPFSPCYRRFAWFAVMVAAIAEAQTHDRVSGFVTRDGGKLFVGKDEFRFISFNIPNLHIVEDNLEDGAATPWRWPNTFEITDALESVRQMGGTVVRTYVLSVARDDSDMGEHVHVQGPGRFNETAFRSLDRALKIAGEKGVRMIIPFVDQWRWWGGIEQYAAHRRLPPDSFWTDRQLIDDFKQTLRFTVTRVNSLTGVRYADDPAILGWETGNEIDAPNAWTSEIARYIRSLDANHLIIDGRSLHGISEEALENEHTDVVTTHHYPSHGRDMVAEIATAIARTRGRKPYFVGEFGFVRADLVQRILDTVIKSECSGALLWSLRFHSRDGGFYWHSEPAAEGRYKAYHWPGFASGQAYDERDVLQRMRHAAFRIRGLPVPTVAGPSAPTRLRVHPDRTLRWRGSAGADRYHVLRGTAIAGPWTQVATDLSDADNAYRPLWHDAYAPVGRDLYYRVVAANDQGSSTPSLAFGPVRFESWHLIDEYRDRIFLESADRQLPIVSADARGTREDAHRLVLHDGDQVTYRVDGTIQRVVLRYYLRQGPGQMAIRVAGPDRNFRDLPAQSATVNAGAGDYGYARLIQLSATMAPRDACFVRFEASTSTDEPAMIELAWLDIEYLKPE